MFTIFANLDNAKKIIAYRKMSRSARMLFLGMIVALVVVMTTGFIWMQTDQVIAPPGLRIMDGLWRMFVCRCPA